MPDKFPEAAKTWEELSASEKQMVRNAFLMYVANVQQVMWQ